MIPRITIPDAHDASLVAAALTYYLHEKIDRVQMGQQRSIPHVKRAGDLLNEIYEAAVDQKVHDKFGPVPTDAEIAEELQKLSSEFGDDTEN